MNYKRKLRSTAIEDDHTRHRVLYIVGNLAKFDVTPIHIFQRLQSLQDTLNSPKVIALLEWSAVNSTENKAEVRSKFSGIGALVRFLPRIPLLSAFVIAGDVMLGNYDIVHAVGYNAMLNGIVVKLITRRKLIFESHGVVPEEMVLRGIWKTKGARYKVAKVLERIFVRYCDHMIVVSNRYRDLVENLYKKDAISVAGCAVATSPAVLMDMRTSARANLGVGSELVIAFSGSFFAEWGDPREYIDLFKAIKGLGFHPIFLVLTQSPVPKVQEFLDRNSIEKKEYRVLNLSHEAVPKILAAADVGLLLRKDSIVNRVASPMKFPEYLLSGVSVIASEDIGDISDLIRMHRLGFIYSKDDARITARLEAWLKSIQSEEGNSLRVRCSEFAENYLSYRAQKELYCSVYTSLSRNHD